MKRDRLPIDDLNNADELWIGHFSGSLQCRALVCGAFDPLDTRWVKDHRFDDRGQAE